jgi:hypothetical protein
MVSGSDEMRWVWSLKDHLKEQKGETGQWAGFYFLKGGAQEILGSSKNYH